MMNYYRDNSKKTVPECSLGSFPCITEDCRHCMMPMAFFLADIKDSIEDLYDLVEKRKKTDSI